MHFLVAFVEILDEGFSQARNGLHHYSQCSNSTPQEISCHATPPTQL